MSTEEELSQWLRRPEKNFSENLEFALKAWQSGELTISSKYEVVLHWLAEVGAEHLEDIDSKAFPDVEIEELLKLQTQPGLISQPTKKLFVEMWLQIAEQWQKKSQKQQATRLPAELLYGLINFELLQDFYRTNFETQAQIYGKLLQLYEMYLQQFNTKHEKNNTSWQPEVESSYFAGICHSLRDNVRRANDMPAYEECYRMHILQPLIQVLLLLRTHALCYFEELLELERTLCESYTEVELLRRIVALPLHVRLLTLECAIVNRRGVEKFLVQLLKNNFEGLLDAEETEEQQRPALALTVAAYTLEMLRMHDINLQFKISGGETMLVYLGKKLFPLISKYIDSNLREVIMLLSAALRLNPILLEHHVFQITTWLIVAPKCTHSLEQQLYEDYMLLLLDMFRRLSRAEKFVSNLLKSVKEWLQKNTLTACFESGKRKANKSIGETPNKKSKLVATLETKRVPIDNYLQILYKDFCKTSNSLSASGSLAAKIHSFPTLQTAWPSATVGVAFSKVITALVSKPSLVIWKSLLYALKELLTELELRSDLSENSLFQLDLHTALLCQYFAGSKLSAQYDKFSAQISEQRQLTATVLTQFGQFLLTHAHNKRTMSAYLECCHQAVSFELLLAYYAPDGMMDENLGSNKLLLQLHRYLSTQEWTLIEQRVANFGDPNCKFLLQRLQLQNAEAKSLLLTPQNMNCDQDPMIESKELQMPMDSDTTQLSLLLQRGSNAKWLTSHLRREQKLTLVKALHNNNELLPVFTEDLACVEFLALLAYQQLCANLASSSTTKKTYLMASLLPYLEPLLDESAGATISEPQIHKLVKAIDAHLKNDTLKSLPSEEVEQTLNTLKQLPVAFLRRPSKCFFFALNLAFYCDLKSAKAHSLAKEAFELLTNFLHFGQQVQIFKFFAPESVLKLFPVDDCLEFYEFIFAGIQNEDKSTERFLLSLINILKAQNSGKLTDTQHRLMLMAIETLSGMNGPSAKRMRKHLESLLVVYAGHIQKHFGKTQGENVKKDKNFVQKTLAGFAAYTNAALSRTAGAKIDGSEEIKSPFVVDELFRRICKVYIGHSMDYRNPHAIRLMQVALNNRQILHLDQDEIEFVLSSYWHQLNENLGVVDQPPTTLAVVKMIIGNKTNEDLLLTLKDIANNVDHKEKINLNVMRLLTLIAKCPFSTIKGAIFNEQFKQISFEIILRLAKNERQQFLDNEQVLSILTCQLAFVENKMIPISVDTLDNILAFLADINIKKFLLTDTNVSAFRTLHLAMTELATSLIKQRHILLIDRVPQFMHIFKDLLQAIVWYKNERQKDVALSSNELEQLAELALKLEALMHIIATHSVAIKRVAPFILTFVIHLMVGNKRPTTLYPQIKTHIESICYDLVGICDHRVGRFILRCSNEAARHVYEILNKDYKKYHKFKGKV